MGVHAFYRLCIWLPIAVPAAVAGAVHGAGDGFPEGPALKIVQILLMSLLYGAVPYAPLALWATWWIGGRSEDDILWLMLRAPLLMAAGYVPAALITGYLVGAPFVPFLAVGILGALVAVPLGYGYVGLVTVLRRTPFLVRS